VQPPITAIDLRPQEAGRRAGALLVSLIATGLPSAAAPTRLEHFDLIDRERESTRPRRA
jgi:DNA-binding LacI/PurR family transcriptional regulator